MRKLRTLELNRLSVDEFQKRPNENIKVLLDNIRSGYNVGSILRTCDAFGVSEVIFYGITPSAENREVIKTSLGSEKSVVCVRAGRVEESLLKHKEEGFKIIAIEQTDSSIELNDFIHSGSEEKLIFIFGNEVSGVSDEILQHADTAIEIPQFGTKHSLNVAIATGIVLWYFRN